MEIKRILSFDDYSKESDLLVSDGENEIMCFAQDYEDGKDFYLIAFFASNIYKMESKQYKIKKESDYYAYSFSGKIEDKLNDRLIVRVFGLLIYIYDDFPGDLLVGDFILFTVKRIDYCEK